MGQSATIITGREVSDAASLRVGLDVSALNPNFKAHAARGIGRYVRELSKFLSGVDSGNLKVGKFEHDQIVNRSKLKPLLDWVPLGRTTLRQQIIYPMQLSNKRVCPFDVVHFPAHMDPPAWGMQNYIVTVLDLIPLVMSDLYKSINPSWRFKLARYLELQAIRNASLVIAISENTARDCEKILGIDPENIVVTPLGVDSKFFIDPHETEADSAVLKKINIPEDREIILYVGGIDPRKNMPGLIKTFQGIRDGRAGKPLLVIAGRITEDKQYPELIKLLDSERVRADTVLAGFVSDEDLGSIYRKAALFLFPSFYEGFGLTPLEAMAAGVPVVSSNTSSMPEVLGESALMVDPNNIIGFIEAGLSVLRQPELSKSLRLGGPARARMFTWQRTGAETLKAYEQYFKRNK